MRDCRGRGSGRGLPQGRTSSWKMSTSRDGRAARGGRGRTVCVNVAERAHLQHSHPRYGCPRNSPRPFRRVREPAGPVPLASRSAVRPLRRERRCSHTQAGTQHLHSHSDPKAHTPRADTKRAVQHRNRGTPGHSDMHAGQACLLGTPSHPSSHAFPASWNVLSRPGRRPVGWGCGPPAPPQAPTTPQRAAFCTGPAPLAGSLVLAGIPGLRQESPHTLSSLPHG